MKLLKTLLCCGLFLQASNLWAQNIAAPASYSGIRFGAGTVLASGSLMDEAQVAGITLDLFSNVVTSDSRGGISGSFLFDFWNISGKNKHTAFPFVANNNVNGSLFSFVPQMCFLANYPLQVCAGLGITQITMIDDSDNMQNYGTIGLTYEVGRFHKEGLIFGIRGRYDQIDQQVAKKKSFAAFASHMVQIGWAWTSGT